MLVKLVLQMVDTRGLNSLAAAAVHVTCACVDVACCATASWLVIADVAVVTPPLY